MMLLFWILTFFFTLLAISIFIPWLKFNIRSLFVFSFIILFTYSFYYTFGASQYLQGYYTSDDLINREQMQRIRPLMTELKKQEYRLRFHLEENPKDYLAQSKLLELLSIQALQSGDQTLAKQFLLKALELLPETSDYLPRKKHLQEMGASL